MLVIGDVHIRPNSMTAARMLVDNIIRYVIYYDIKYVIFLGDILHDHERIHVPCMNLAIELFDTISKYATVYVIVGNHDMINHLQFCSHEHWMNALKYHSSIYVIDIPTVIHYKSKKIGLCPYVAPGRFTEAFDLFNINIHELDLIFAHQEFKFAQMGIHPSSIGDEWGIAYTSSVPWVISGHIHDKQILHEQRVYYTGSSLQTAFNENHKKSIIHIDMLSEQHYQPQLIDSLVLNIKCISEFNMDDWHVKELRLLDIPVKKHIHLSLNENVQFHLETLYTKLTKSKKNVTFKVTIITDDVTWKCIQTMDVFRSLSSRCEKVVFKNTQESLNIDSCEVINVHLNSNAKVLNTILHGLASELEEKDTEIMNQVFLEWDRKLDKDIYNNEAFITV